MLAAVPPLLPGLINSINTKISVDAGAMHLFDFAWLYGVRSSFRAAVCPVS